MIKAVILDFDGTLGDTRRLIVSTMQQTIAALGLEARTDSQCAAMIGLPLRDTFTRLIDMDDATGDRCTDTYTRLFYDNARKMAVPLFPHVAETIRHLHGRGVLLTIASSRRRDSLMMFLRDMHLDDYISYVVSATDVVNAKPAPDMVVRTLADNRLTADRTIVVGDTPYDILMAHAAGVKAVAVTYGDGTMEDLTAARPYRLIDDFADITGIVESL